MDGQETAMTAPPPGAVVPAHGAILAERERAGRDCRTAVPRSAHAAWSPPSDRPDPVSLLQQSDANRLQSLLPIRYGRMSASPLGFLRGAAAVMARDLAATPSTGIPVQLAGDAHLANFGAYGTPERNLVFGVNDFDETLPGPWEWDIKRLAASVVVAGRTHGFTAAECSASAAVAVRAYRERMAEYTRMGYLDLYHTQIDEAHILHALARPVERKVVKKGAVRARSRDHLQALSTMTETIDGRLRIKDDPPLVTHVSDPHLGDVAGQVATRYLRTLEVDRAALMHRYTYVDAALKVVGVGSVGTRCFIVLFLGANEDDPLFLQIKESLPSALEPYLGASPWKTHGQRVVAGQRIIQAASDIFLGWGRDRRRDFYVRQLRDMKASVNLATITASALESYAAVCGWALALAHARSGDPAQISGYLGTGDRFDRALTSFANAYADQTERDHATLVKAIKSGRIQAEPGV
jgi:uncharacterized protein (DUF2252 family)